MVLTYFDKCGLRHISDFSDIYNDGTAFLIGGGPSLLSQNLKLLNTPGVVSMALNNAALNVRPLLWCGADNPKCYDYSILADPGITKFTSLTYYNTEVYGRLLREYSNTYFFTLKNDVLWENMFSIPKDLPWFNNLFFTAIAILHAMGIRHIVLLGCPFAIDSKPYAAEIELSSHEINQNRLVYSQQREDLIGLKPIFDLYQLKISDATINSSLKGYYDTIALDEAVNDITVKSKNNKLWHCTHFGNINKKYI